MPASGRTRVTLLLVICAAVVLVVGTALWFVIKPGSSTALIWGVAVVVPVMIGAVIWTRMQATAQRQQAFAEHGLPGTAEVLRIEPTNVIVGRRAQARMQLRIRVEGREPYEIEHVDFLPFAGFGLVAGQRMRVRVSPDAPDQVSIDWSVPPEGSGTRGSAAERMEALDLLRSRGQINEAEYQRKRDEILSDL